MSALVLARRVLFGAGIVSVVLLPGMAQGDFLGAVGIKGAMFFPNRDSNGLQGFDLGFGIAAEGRFGIAPMFALSPQVGFLQSSGTREAGGTRFNAYFNNVPIELNVVFTPPLEWFDAYAGGGGSYNFAKMSWTGTPDSDSAAGWGYQAKAGIGHALGFGNLYFEAEASWNSVRFSNQGGTYGTQFGRSDLNLQGGGVLLFFGYKIGF